jgi:predicted negative regulator of RcsB-dependent stress response
VAITPDDSEYGGQTVTGAGWPHANEDDLASAATSFESLMSHLRYEVIPAARQQMMKLSDSWEGKGSQAALDEASAIIDKNEANAAAAEDTAQRLRKMEASVVKTKNAVNKQRRRRPA